MDELDDDLFGTISRKKNFPLKQDSVKSNAQPITDFNEDDPLADLLSEDEDFQTSPKPSRAQMKGGNFVTDLFGIKSTDSAGLNAAQGIAQPKSGLILENIREQTDKSLAKSENRIGLSNASPKKVLDDIQKPKPLQRANNTIKTDGIGSSASDQTKKSSLMEDLFGTRPKSNPVEDKLVPKEPIPMKLETSEVQKKSEQLSKPSSTGYAPSLSVPRDSRRGRRTSGGIADPLGMFSSPAIAQETSGAQNFEVNSSKLDYPSSSKIGETVKGVEVPTEDLPEWLGGKKKLNQSTVSQAKKDLPENVTLEASHTSGNLPEAIENEALENSGYPLNYSEHLAALTGTKFDQQAMMMSLQQQEHELRTAATLSRQSEQLNKMIESQRNRLNDQEKQFNVLIKRQIDRQELLEVQMKAQQDRINSHLQVLLAQPSSVPIASSIIDSKDLNEKGDENNKSLIEFQNIFQKFEGEKLCFENMLDRLKDQHVKEIAMIEESYTRQIETMNQGTERLEKRLRQDVELAEADYEAKIQKLKEEQVNLKIAHGEEIESLKKEHIKQIQEMRDQQHRNIEQVQNEYIETIANISKAKDIERQTISNATTQTTNLTDTLQLIKVTMTEIGELKMKIGNNTEENNRDKELILKQQIEELKDLRDNLKKQHEVLQVDRQELTEATRRMDGGALRLISEFDRQVKENIEAEKRLKLREETLLKDKELLDAQIQWERNHIQAMKESWIREQDRQAKQLSEERNSIAAERARLETLEKLKLDDNETTKTELEAALSTAREASNLANRERQKWRERFNELEVQKQQIKEKEHSLKQRAKELEDLTQSALEKREEGLRALKEARYIEEQHKAYLSQLQIQSQALAERESKIAAEKLALARDRLALRMGETDKPQRDTGKISELGSYVGDQHRHTVQYNDLPDSQMTTTHFKDIVDPRLVLLKLGLDDELDVSNDCLGTLQSIVQ